MLVTARKSCAEVPVYPASHNSTANRRLPSRRNSTSTEWATGICRIGGKSRGFCRSDLAQSRFAAAGSYVKWHLKYLLKEASDSEASLVILSASLCIQVRSSSRPDLLDRSECGPDRFI